MAQSSDTELTEPNTLSALCPHCLGSGVHCDSCRGRRMQFLFDLGRGVRVTIAGTKRGSLGRDFKPSKVSLLERLRDLRFGCDDISGLLRIIDEIVKLEGLGRVLADKLVLAIADGGHRLPRLREFPEKEIVRRGALTGQGIRRVGSIERPFDRQRLTRGAKQHRKYVRANDRFVATRAGGQTSGP